MRIFLYSIYIRNKYKLYLSNFKIHLDQVRFCEIRFERKNRFLFFLNSKKDRCLIKIPNFESTKDISGTVSV
ncbi:hypothetical protein LEP1GSC161_1903 [Leptospira santarosai str. CBC1416]|uniref:Uncharacterized protein n=1 Tax=Leptospira santarosai str. CBC1416 TaxID=1193059 RepID=M6W6Q4_9LEPT|nr:hypothetical protein LEP1GSC161_1903 [Leptospira santarosai str. CBC1416]